MTKLRPPLTIENALFRVIGLITIERAAQVTGREAHYLRSVSDPDTRYRLTIDDAVKLDLEYAVSGGIGFPLFETYDRILQVGRSDRFVQADAIQRATVDVIKEGGEAHKALVEASFPGATAHERRVAAKEVEEAMQALQRAMPLLISPAPCEAAEERREQAEPP